MQTQVQHTHLAVCSTQSEYEGWATHRGVTSNEGGAPACAGGPACFGELAARPPKQKSTYHLPVYIYMISRSLLRPTPGSKTGVG